MKKERVYLALGSNIQPKEQYLFDAILHLCQHKTTTDFKCAKFYVTTPVGGPPQDTYINTCVSFFTTLSPEELLDFTQSIEKKAHKRILVKNGPRTLDIDILFFANRCINQEGLKVPHPRWKDRLFVLQPLSDLCDMIYIDDQDEKPLCFDLQTLIRDFKNPNNEKLSLLKSEFYHKIRALELQTLVETYASH